MKRIELLEALYLQGKKMRELQMYYFSLRKGGGRFSSPEAKKVLEQSKLEELQYDKMVKELDEWWSSASLSHQASDGTPPTPLSDQEEDLSFYGDLANGCTGNCGMNYCDENGCVERKRILVDGEPHVADKVVCNPVNDQDDDIRI
jgi:hypothetical protein